MDGELAGRGVVFAGVVGCEVFTRSAHSFRGGGVLETKKQVSGGG